MPKTHFAPTAPRQSTQDTWTQERGHWKQLDDSTDLVVLEVNSHEVRLAFAARNGDLPAPSPGRGAISSSARRWTELPAHDHRWSAKSPEVSRFAANSNGRVATRHREREDSRFAAGFFPAFERDLGRRGTYYMFGRDGANALRHMLVTTCRKGGTVRLGSNRRLRVVDASNCTVEFVCEGEH